MNNNHNLCRHAVRLPALTKQQRKRRKHVEHLRCRKPKRQGSRNQTGKLLPIKIPEEKALHNFFRNKCRRKGR